MEKLVLDLTVILFNNDGKALPDQARLIEQFMDHVYDFYDRAGTLTQSVQVTAINGDPVS